MPNKEGNPDEMRSCYLTKLPVSKLVWRDCRNLLIRDVSSQLGVFHSTRGLCSRVTGRGRVDGGGEEVNSDIPWYKDQRDVRVQLPKPLAWQEREDATSRPSPPKKPEDKTRLRGLLEVVPGWNRGRRGRTTLLELKQRCPEINIQGRWSKVTFPCHL